MKKNVQLKRLLFSIESLVDLGQEASSSKELTEKMRAALYVMTGIFSVPTAVLFVYQPHRKSLELFVEKGRRDKPKKKIKLSVAPEHAAGFTMNEPHAVRNMARTAFFRQNEDIFTLMQTALFIPLFAKGELVGAIALGKKLGKAAYHATDKDVLRVIAHQLAITLHNARLFLELAKKASENKRLYAGMQRIYHDTIQAFAAAIDAKDDYTKDHSYRVASYAVAIARELGWKKNDVEGIYIAGLLHDIGKIIVDRDIINKGEKLTAPEICEIQKHPEVSYDILSKVKFPWKNIDYFVRHHHERLDGKGYPDALMATELSDGVKILALVDAFDAMTTDRPYRGKMALVDAFREVMSCRGTQFDEIIADTFFRMLRQELRGESKEPQILPHLQNIDVSGFLEFGQPGVRNPTRGDRFTSSNAYVVLV